jgi:hypothetical protein
MNRPLRTRMMGGVGGVGEYLPQPDYVAVFNRQPNCYATCKPLRWQAP